MCRSDSVFSTPTEPAPELEFDTEEELGPKRLVHASIWHFIRAFSALYLVDLIW